MTDYDRIYFNATGDGKFVSKLYQDDVVLTLLADESIGVDSKKTGQKVFERRVSKVGKPYHLVELPNGKYFVRHGTNDRGEYLVANKAEDRAPGTGAGGGGRGGYGGAPRGPQPQRPTSYGQRPAGTR